MFSTNFKKYLSSIQDDYEFIKKFARRRNGICGVKMDDITELPYQTLKHKIPDLFKIGEFEKAMYLILKHYGKNVTFGNVRKARNSHKLCFLLWIKEQYEKIGKMEEQYLYSPPDSKLLQAGIRELDILEDKVLINRLVKFWEGAYTHKEIRMMPYCDIFDAQLEFTIWGRVNKKLVEINKNQK